jgi:DNA-binding response OmpR family regulator
MKEKVLLALSDPELSKRLVAYLSNSGYVVSSVSDGNAVIPSLKDFKPSILLIDTVLPNKSGYDVLNEKSFDRDVTKIPVIIISNSGEAIHIKKIPSTPVVKDYIIKLHVAPEEVAEKIDKVFGRGPLVESETTESSSIGKGKTILWVDDDKLLSTILSKKFQSSGFTLLKGSTGKEFLEFLDISKPDIMILDINLPDMTGLDILVKVRSKPQFKKIPIIMLSNNHKHGIIEECIELGADKFITKATVSPAEIINEVNTLIQRYRA